MEKKITRTKRWYELDFLTISPNILCPHARAEANHIKRIFIAIALALLLNGLATNWLWLNRFSNLFGKLIEYSVQCFCTFIDVKNPAEQNLIVDYSIMKNLYTEFYSKSTAPLIEALVYNDRSFFLIYKNERTWSYYLDSCIV